MSLSGGVNGGGQGPRGPRLVPERPRYCDPQLERQVLAAFIAFPELIESEVYAPGDFSSTANAMIYSVMTDLRREGEDVDTTRVRARLEDLGRLEHIGGFSYLFELTQGVAIKTLPFDRLRKLARMRDFEAAATRLTIAARSGEGVGAAYEALERAKTEIEKVGRPPEPHPLERIWKTLGELGSLASAPPPRRWLLTRPDHETAGHTVAGVMQLGKVGVLHAAGGAGKTITLVGLALAVATGRRWLEHFSVASPGRVLIALAEEDLEEVHRRFYSVARAMRLTDEQVRIAGENIVALPLAGVPVTLVDAEGVDTETLRTLRQRIAADHFQLVILDPLSRFAGVDTEKDNAAATRFIQATESLVIGAGAPAVLLAHHTSKGSRSDGTKASAAHARGASAITDGARWVAELESHGDDGARFTVVKSNYGAQGLPLELVRDADGYLRAATKAELELVRDARQKAQQAEDAEDFAAVSERVLAALADKPDQTKSALATHLKVRSQKMSHVVSHLEALGKVVLVSKYGYNLAPVVDAPVQEVLDV